MAPFLMFISVIFIVAPNNVEFIDRFCIVTWRLKAGTVQSEQTFIAWQGLGKHVTSATNTQATMERLLSNGVYRWVRL
jgi:hypothetical protein